MTDGVVHYGQSKTEKLAEENEICRQMLREINNFGISQRQTLTLIYLLASELENTEHMRAITRLVRELGNGELFLIDMEDEVGGKDGTSGI